MLMRVLMVSLKLLAALAAMAACAWMATRLGPWKSLALFAGVMGLVCCMTAWIVHRQPPETVTFANYLMAIVLPWGYRIGHGKLRPIILTSWCIWVLLGASAVLATHARRHVSVPTEPVGQRNTTVMTLLALAWIVDGGVL